jgi:hypothetical protein
LYGYLHSSLLFGGSTGRVLLPRWDIVNQGVFVHVHLEQLGSVCWCFKAIVILLFPRQWSNTVGNARETNVFYLLYLPYIRLLLSLSASRISSLTLPTFHRSAI